MAYDGQIRGVCLIYNSARQLADAFQASDVGALPAELDKQGDDQHILINIGDRS